MELRSALLPADVDSAHLQYIYKYILISAINCIRNNKNFLTISSPPPSQGRIMWKVYYPILQLL